MTGRTHIIDLLDETFAICRLDPSTSIPKWADSLPFCSVSRSEAELSIICPDVAVPADVGASRGWRAFRLRGPFALDETGVLVSVANPLAAIGLSVMAIATYDTDYLLVNGNSTDAAIRAMREAGHSVEVSEGP
jgi:hypothetical protein